MILLQALGAVVLVAAVWHLALGLMRAWRRNRQELERGRRELDLLGERVLLARARRECEESRQSLSWSGYRKFVVASKVFEDGGLPAAAPETPAWKPGATLVPGQLEATLQLEGGVARLVPLDGGPDHLLEGEELVLGRARDCAVVVDNGKVSARHARLFRKGADWFVQDLQSRNGTRVNMEKVGAAPVRLRSEDHLRLGVVDFRVQLPGAPAGGQVPQVCSLYLVPHDGKPLPPFLPGQHLTFQLRVPGRDKPLVRCYSLSDRPHPEYYRVTVKRLTAGLEGSARHGQGSAFIHDGLREGDIVDVQAPRGSFHLDPLADDRPVVLIAGGIGLTPLLSMLNSLAERRSPREVWLFYGVRCQAQHLMREHLARLARERENLRVEVCYSAPAPGDLEGYSDARPGRVSVELLRERLPSNNYDFYVCGPSGMISQVDHDLRAWGVPPARIHYEAFGPATVRQVAAPPAGATAEAPRPKVVFARSGRESTWPPEAASLLELAEAQGVRIDSGCRAGHCGTCLTAVRSGQFACSIEPAAPVGPGTCLACVSVPVSDLVLDA